MRIKKKLKGSGGFTLAETLLAVLILLLVSTIVATGMPAAKNAYEKIVVAANAQVLLSTTATALRDELGTAWDVNIDDSTTVSYNSSDTGAKSKLYLKDGKIYIQEYVDNDYLNTKDGTGVGKERLLVSDKAATSDLVVTFTSLSKVDTEKTVVITGLVVNNKEGNPMAQLDATLKIPVLSFAPVNAG